MRKPIIFLVTFFVLLSPLLAASAIDHFQRGNRYREAGEAAKSVLEYEEAIRLNPYYKEAYYSLGLIYNASGLSAKATSTLEKAIEIDPNYTQAMVALGVVYDRSARGGQAIEIFSRALEIEPNNKEARLGLGAVYRRSRLWDRAIAEYERVMGVDPQEDLALVGLGDVSRDQGLLDDAINYYTQALALNPRRLQAYLKQGETFEKQGFKERALQNYRSALKLDPLDVRPYRSLGRFHINRGDLDEAIDAYLMLTSLSPLDGFSHYALGLAHERRGKLKEAIDDYSEALRLRPDDEIARYRLEEVLIKNDAGGNPSPRRREMALYHLVQGDRYYDSLEMKKALYEYERALHLGRQDPSVRRRIALVYEFIGYRERAISELRIFLELEPDNVDGRDRLERLIREKDSSATAEGGVDLGRVPDSGTSLAIFDLLRAEDGLETHIDLGTVAADFIKLLLRDSGRVNVLGKDEVSAGMGGLGLSQVGDITQAQRVAQRIGAEAFLFGEAAEGPEEMSFSLRLIWVDSGQDLTAVSLTERGNHRVMAAVAAASEAILGSVPFRGLIIGLDRDRAVINLGRMEDISEGMEFVIYRQRLLRSAPSDGGGTLSEEEVGRLRVTGVDERVAVGRITTQEALRQVNVGDVVRALVEPPPEGEGGS